MVQLLSDVLPSFSSSLCLGLLTATLLHEARLEHLWEAALAEGAVA